MDNGKDTDELFNKNLKQWALVCPWGASQLKNMSCSHISFGRGASGALNLIYKDGAQSVWLHHPDNPESEAAEWFKSLHLKNIDVIFVLGVGLGYYYEAAREWLHQNEKRTIVFFEMDAEVVHRLLETEQGTALVSDKQAALYLFDQPNFSEAALNAVIMPYAVFNSTITCLQTYAPRFNVWHPLISYFVAMHKYVATEYRDFGIIILRNFVMNYLNLPHSYLADKLFGKFKDVPAIICGAGPSIDKNIDVLATLGDRALIFAGGTALNALNARGVMPHFGLGIDPNISQFTRLLANQAYELPFLYRSRMNHQAFEIVHGDRLYVTGTAGYHLGKWMEQKLGFAQDLIMDEGFNVLNFSLVLAHAMGCNPLICVGIDLAYSGGNSYASGIASHPIHDRRENFRTKTNEDEIVTKNDIFGKPVETLWKWISESGWYSTFAVQHPEAKLINATEGGIGFDKVANMSLKQVKHDFLGKQYDLHTRLHGEIQNSLFPPTATEERVRDCLTQLAIGLKACAEHCQEILKLFAQSCSAESPDQVDAYAGKIKDAIKKLEDEEAYKVILEVFNNDYAKVDLPLLMRLRFDEGRLTAQEIERKKNQYASNRYKKLHDTASFQAGMFQYIIKEKAKHEKITEIAQEKEKMQVALHNLKQIYPLPQPTPEESYAFDGQFLTLIDPELGLDYQEPFKPNADQKMNLYYPDGALKFEQFYRGGLLHGPSTFYHENGAVLAQAWFLDGQRQGKMRTLLRFRKCA